MASVTVVMSGDDARLRASHEKLLSDQQKLLDRYTKLTQQSAKSAEMARKEASTRRAVAAAEKEALAARERGKKLTEQSLTPQERLNKRLAEVKRLREQGNISLETATRLLRKYRSELKAEEQAVERSSDAYKRKVKIEQEAKTAIERLSTPTERYQQELRKLVRAKREGVISSEELRRRHKQLREEFGKSRSVSTLGAEIGKLAATYLSAELAIRAVNTVYQEQVELQQRSLDLTKEIAGAQEKASKNFAGLPEAERQKMSQAVVDIQSRTGFPERKAIVDALGTAQSASADSKLARKTVGELAPLARNAPDALEDFALGTLNTTRALGNDNVREAAGLLLSIGGKAQVTDPKKLARAVGPVLQSAVANLPNNSSQELKERAAIGAGSLLAALTKAASDDKGESSVTAFIQMSTKLREFFDNIPNEIADREERLKELAEKAKVTEEEKLAIAKRGVALEKASFALKDARQADDAATPEGKLRIKEAELAIKARQRELQEEKDGAALTKEDIAERRTLRGQLVELAKFEERAPVLVGKQIQALQQSPFLARQFQDQGEFGEARFNTAFDKLLDARSQVSRDFVRFSRGPEAIRVSDAEFQSQLKQQRATSELANADFANKLAGLEERAKLDPNLAIKEAAVQAVMVASQQLTATRGFLTGHGNTGVRELVARNITIPRIRSATSDVQALQLAEDFLAGGTSKRFFSGRPERSNTEEARLLIDTLREIRAELAIRRGEGGALDNAAGKLEGAANNLARPGAGANAQAGAAVGVGAQ